MISLMMEQKQKQKMQKREEEDRFREHEVVRQKEEALRWKKIEDDVLVLGKPTIRPEYPLGFK